MGIITQDVVKQVARLARLRLDGRELAGFVTELDEILEYVRQLDMVSTDGIAPTSHAMSLSNVLRKDMAHISLAKETVLDLAPSKKMPFIKVPKVIES